MSRPNRVWPLLCSISLGFTCLTALAAQIHWLTTSIDGRDPLETSIAHANDSHARALILYNDGLDAVVTPLNDPTQTLKQAVSLNATSITSKFALSHKIFEDPESGYAFASIVGNLDLHLLGTVDYLNWMSSQVTWSQNYFNSWTGVADGYIYLGGFNGTGRQWDVYGATTTTKSFTLKRVVNAASGFQGVDSIDRFPRSELVVNPATKRNAVFAGETDDNTWARMFYDCSNGTRQNFDTVAKSQGIPESVGCFFDGKFNYAYFNDGLERLTLVSTDCSSAFTKKLLSTVPALGTNEFFGIGLTITIPGIAHLIAPGVYARTDIDSNSTSFSSHPAPAEKLGPYSMTQPYGTGTLVGYVPGSTLFAQLVETAAVPAQSWWGIIVMALVVLWIGIRVVKPKRHSAG